MYSSVDSWVRSLSFVCCFRISLQRGMTWENGRAEKSISTIVSILLEELHAGQSLCSRVCCSTPDIATADMRLSVTLVILRLVSRCENLCKTPRFISSTLSSEHPYVPEMLYSRLLISPHGVKTRLYDLYSGATAQA